MRAVVALLATTFVASPASACAFNGTHDEIASAARTALAYNDSATAAACIKKAATLTLSTLSALVDVLSQQNKSEAATTITAAIETIGGDGEAMMFHAKQLLQVGSFEAARVRFELLVQNNPEHARLHQYLSLSQWNSGQQDESVRTIHRAAALDPHFKADSKLLSSLRDKQKADGGSAAQAPSLQVGKEEV
jgi:Flp pilus assembly protein TadD